MLTLATVAALLVLASGTAAAGRGGGGGGGAGGIDQGSFSTWTTENNDIFNNEVDMDLGQSVVAGTISNGFGDAAVAAANCQLITVADAWVLVLAASEALGVITDEDDIVVASEPIERGGFLIDGLDFDEENATSTCRTPVGPVNIHVSTAPGWGEAAPNGSFASAVGALSGGGGYKSNDIDQGSFSTSASADNVVKNDLYLQMSAFNSATSASNCQAFIGAHMGLTVIGASVAEANVEDSDSIEIAGADEPTDVGASSVGADLRLGITIENDHLATSTCHQPIDSIDIEVGNLKR